MRIGVIHATDEAIRPIREAILRQRPEAVVVNFLNEGLLDHANRVHGVDDWGIRNFLQTATLAAQAGLDGIIVACTLYTNQAGLVQELAGIPAIGVDLPMVRQAVEHGGKIGILATTAASGPLAEAKIQAEANRTGKQVDTLVLVVEEAMAALKAGEVSRHNGLLKQAAGELREKGCGVLVLSQLSMAVAAPELRGLGLDVLTSPDAGAREIISLIGG